MNKTQIDENQLSKLLAQQPSDLSEDLRTTCSTDDTTSESMQIDRVSLVSQALEGRA